MSDVTPRRFSLLLTSLIATATFLGALGSWRASEASGAAREAERKAVSDQRTAVQQDTVIRAGIAATEFDYLRRNSLLTAAAAMRAEAATAPPDTAADLIALATAYELAASNQPIDPDALRPDGSLDLEAKYDLEWYAAGLRQDLDPMPEFREAEALRLKAERIVGVTALFVAAALVFTLAEVSRNQLGRSIYLSGGLAIGGAAVILLVLLETA